MFAWFQDFYLNLEEGDQRITPRDYLELALKPVQGRAKDIAAKNEVVFNSVFSCEMIPALRFLIPRIFLDK